VDKHKKRKKPNRQARLEKKKEHADTFNYSFSLGYEIGYNQAIRDVEEGKLDCNEKRKDFYK
jgi:hypothetical protein